MGVSNLSFLEGILEVPGKSQPERNICGQNHCLSYNILIQLKILWINVVYKLNFWPFGRMTSLLRSIYKSNGKTKKSRKLASPQLIFPEARPTENRRHWYFIFQPTWRRAAGQQLSPRNFSPANRQAGSGHSYGTCSVINSWSKCRGELRRSQLYLKAIHIMYKVCAQNNPVLRILLISWYREVP